MIFVKKLNFFHFRFLGKNYLEKMFEDLLHRKESILAYKKMHFRYTHFCIFSKINDEFTYQKRPFLRRLSKSNQGYVFPRQGNHLVICSRTWETHIPSDMCSPTWETEIPSDMCSPTWETHITRDTCFPGGGTHINRDMCYNNNNNI